MLKVMIQVNLAGKVLSAFENPILELFVLYLIQGMIGFLFGMSLVYMMKWSSRRRATTAVILMILFYVVIWLLNDYTFARRIIQVFALGHVIMVGFIIRKRERELHSRRDTQGT